MALNVLITGVSGFVGKNLVSYFGTRNDVKLFGHGRDFMRLKNDFSNQAVTILEDYKSGQLDQYTIHSIIHTAGIAHDMSKQYKDDDYFRVNEDGTKLAFETFLNSGARQFIFLSSIKAVIDSYEGLLTEDVKPSPKTPYGESKLQAERYIRSVPLPTGKQYFVLRPCMIHGPGNKGNLNLLYKFVSAGIPYPLGAFENQRSFLSIDNFCFMVDHILNGNVPAGTYNLADTGFISSAKLFALIADTAGKKPRIWKVPASLVNTVASLAGKKRMLGKLTENMMVSNKKILAFVPPTLATTLENGIIKTIQSFRGE